MAMVWTIRRRLRLIEFPVRRAQPALPYRCMRLDRAEERDLAIVGIEQPQDKEDIGVDGFRGEQQAARNRSRDLGFGLEWRRLEGQSFAHRLVVELARHL